MTVGPEVTGGGQREGRRRMVGSWIYFDGLTEGSDKMVWDSERKGESKMTS